MKVAVVYAAKSTADNARLDPDAAGGLPPPRRARGLAGRHRVPRRGRTIVAVGLSRSDLAAADSQSG
jgi:hypothetical protein